MFFHLCGYGNNNKVKSAGRDIKNQRFSIKTDVY